MDKRKVLLIGDAMPTGGFVKEFLDKAIADGREVEVVPPGSLQGKRLDLMIWDEGPLPVLDLDFSELETRICGMYDTLPKTPDRGTVTGRLSHPEPAVLPGMYGLPYRRMGKSILQQDLYAMLAEEMHKADRNMAKLLYPTGQGAGDLLRYGRMSVPMDVKNNGADHPSRKREPKGPRGQWGKLK